ncbi:MAG TPA: enoyl-CoA hydratase/isomerase family protein [Candidatus Xenobia bacterium]|jgi:2-(1,2-epoxy-1,2-dihydrophenyl)acetyl-CoA isomerase
MSLVLSQSDGPIHRLTLNRPDKLNALVGDMRELLLAGLREAEARPDCRIVIVTGAGRAFCSGGDVAAMEAMESDPRRLEPLLLAGAALVKAIRTSRLPVVAAINGVAAGAGLHLAMACDMRVAAESATLSAPFVRIGLHPDWGGTWFLPRLVGPGQAMRLLMTGAQVTAQEALHLGLVEQVVPAEDLTRRVDELAGQIAAGPPRVVASIKRAVYQGHDVDVDVALAYEAQAQLTAFASPNAREGLAARRERRPPRFQ